MIGTTEREVVELFPGGDETTSDEIELLLMGVFTQGYVERAAFLRVWGERRVMRVVFSVNTSKLASASLTAFEVGKALAMAGSSKTTEVPAATAG